jgi:DNA-binding NarL/FixJ family response regulator
MIRILVADDHAVVRAGLQQIFALVPDIEVAAQAENAAQVTDQLHRDSFDLLLLDLNMPGADGVDLVSRLHQRWPALPILVFTMHNEPHIAASALRAGAQGYITKDSNLDVLLPAIRKVAAHGHVLSPGLAEQIVFYENRGTQGASHLLLTARENQVFRQLVQGASVGEIASVLRLSSKTISTHKVRLMKKIGCSNLADLMRYAMAHELLH